MRKKNKSVEKIISISITIQGIEFQCSSFKQNDEEALCLYIGNPEDYTNSDIIVRIHSGCITSEVFGMENCDCKWQLDKAIEIIGKSSAGIIIYLPGQEGKGNGLFNKINSFKMMNLGLKSSDAYEMIGLPSDKRNFDFAIQILKEFKVGRIRLITNSPAKIMACIDGGLVVSERIPVVMKNPNSEIKQLLENKKKYFNHLIN
jgi:GTP cyclohydrolase II